MKKKYFNLLFSLLFTCGIGSNVIAHEHHHEMKGSAISKKSIYLLDAKWKDQNNKSMQLKNLEGKPVVMTMLYSTCTKSCPIIVNYMKGVQDLLSDEERSKVNFLVISINPEKDTPKVLKEFEKKNKLDNNFSLLNGSPDSVLEVASLVGIRYAKDGDEFSHTNKILILNKKGEIVHQNEGLNEKLSDMKKNIQKYL